MPLEIEQYARLRKTRSPPNFAGFRHHHYVSPDEDGAGKLLLKRIVFTTSRHIAFVKRAYRNVSASRKCYVSCPAGRSIPRLRLRERCYAVFNRNCIVPPSRAERANTPDFDTDFCHSLYHLLNSKQNLLVLPRVRDRCFDDSVYVVLKILTKKLTVKMMQKARCASWCR